MHKKTITVILVTEPCGIANQLPIFCLIASLSQEKACEGCGRKVSKLLLTLIIRPSVLRKLGLLILTFQVLDLDSEGTYHTKVPDVSMS